MKRWEKKINPIDWDKFSFTPIEVMAKEYNALGNFIPNHIYKAVWEHNRYYVVIGENGKAYSVPKVDFIKCTE